MADSSPAKKLKRAGSSQLICPYGANCYRKNPQHFKEYSHSSSGNSSTDDTDSAAIKSRSTVKPDLDDSATLPPCKYGVNCYRQNLLHFAQFSHPVLDPIKTTDDSDTDAVDSDEEEKEEREDKKPVVETDILINGLSLVKKYTLLTYNQRMELIKRAFEEKDRLEKELEGTRQKMKEKDEELQQMQKKLKSGLLMLDGEEEALQKTETTYFKLIPERAYKEGSASQIHFRMAESQFYRLLSQDSSARYLVTSVEYVVSPQVVRRFRKYQEELRQQHGEDYSDSILGFHGTQEKNIKLICEDGFKTPGDKGFNQRTDSGFYGAGIYFSEFPSYSMAYIQGASKLMLCQVLPGKVYTCTSLIEGASLKSGYDSHMSPCKNELVIFKPQGILPRYIIYFSDKVNVTKLQQDGGPLVSSETAFTADTEYQEALTKPPSDIFEGTTITLCGNLCVSHDKVYKLILKHGGKRGTKRKFDILITPNGSTIGNSAEEKSAFDNDHPIVTESYVFRCIIMKEKLPTRPFLISFDD